jgi:hypothetical protein
MKEDIDIDWANNNEKEVNIEKIECDHGDDWNFGVIKGFIKVNK